MHAACLPRQAVRSTTSDQHHVPAPMPFTQIQLVTLDCRGVGMLTSICTPVMLLGFHNGSAVTENTALLLVPGVLSGHVFVTPMSTSTGRAEPSMYGCRQGRTSNSSEFCCMRGKFKHSLKTQTSLLLGQNVCVFVRLLTALHTCPRVHTHVTGSAGTHTRTVPVQGLFVHAVRTMYPTC